MLLLLLVIPAHRNQRACSAASICGLAPTRVANHSIKRDRSPTFTVVPGQEEQSFIDAASTGAPKNVLNLVRLTSRAIRMVVLGLIAFQATMPVLLFESVI